MRAKIGARRECVCLDVYIYIYIWWREEGDRRCVRVRRRVMILKRVYEKDQMKE